MKQIRREEKRECVNRKMINCQLMLTSISCIISLFVQLKQRENMIERWEKSGLLHLEKREDALWKTTKQILNPFVNPGNNGNSKCLQLKCIPRFGYCSYSQCFQLRRFERNEIFFSVTPVLAIPLFLFPREYAFSSVSAIQKNESFRIHDLVKH